MDCVDGRERLDGVRWACWVAIVLAWAGTVLAQEPPPPGESRVWGEYQDFQEGVLDRCGY